MAFNIGIIKGIYGKFNSRVVAAKELTGTLLTLVNKIFDTHLWNRNTTKTYIYSTTSGTVCQDVTVPVILFGLIQSSTIINNFPLTLKRNLI